MSNLKILKLKIDELNIQIDESDSLPRFEIIDDSGFVNVRPSIKKVEKLYNFIENYLKLYRKKKEIEKEKEREAHVIILPYDK